MTTQLQPTAIAKPAQSSAATKPLTRQDFRLFHRLRVRWVEVDLQKIVFNGHYLMYLDTAMGDYWRELAFPYEASMHTLGGDMFVKKAGVEYHASARLDDQLDVGLKCVRIGSSSMVFMGGVFRGDELLVTGELLYVYANPATQKSQAVPAALRAMFEDFEAGADMAPVQIGHWNELGPLAQPLRSDVFVQEQRIPADLVWDVADHTALHAVSVNHLGLAVATGRLVTLAPGVSKIGRMAVHRVLRGANFGKAILNALVEQSRRRGDHEVCLHAQSSAVGFYQRLGFAPRGEVFEEAGIAHQEMFKPLSRTAGT